MKFSMGTMAVLGVVILGGVAAGTALWGNYIAEPGPLASPTTVMVNPGSGTAVIARDLQNAGVIIDARAFRLAVKAMQLDSSLKAGEYAFDPGISLRAVVNKLAIGDTKNRSVTFPEGWTVRQIAERLEQTEGLEGKVVRPAEGSVFPDTYAFRFGTEREKLIVGMQERMTSEVNAAWAGRDQSIPVKGPDELLILASIVQKEAANEGEMPMVAAVFINRLKKGMRLQSDPTVIYGAEDYKGDIRHKDLKDENPFNTYTNAGLPPTPICSPGKAALLATAHPAQSDALFFVADPTRTKHVFAATYEEHLKNVKNFTANAVKVAAWNTSKTMVSPGMVSVSAVVTPSVPSGTVVTPGGVQPKKDSK